MSENLNLKTISTIDPSPFRHLCVTIGELPSAFIESMSYYELLAWFVNYLENTVIPAVNANGEATAELQELFVELQTFVDEYFDNLDVQEEINNKLDAMAEAGTLQEIITTYIQANVAWTFDTVADMKAATNLVAGSYARTLGFRSINDGGGALYKITNTGTANEMDIIAIDSLFANLVLPTVATPEMFGSYGDGTHDDTTSLSRTFAVAKNIKFGKDYVISNKIDILSGTTLDAAFHTVTNNTAINFFRATSQQDIVIKNFKAIGDDSVSEAQIALNFLDCNNILVENVDIRNTGGDGVSFGTCDNCTLRDAYLKNNLISAFAYNAHNILFDNIKAVEPRFQFGIQFKSCQHSEMNNIYVDTPQDCGVYVSKGGEEGSIDTFDINLNNISVINEAQNGDTSGGTQYAIVMANGTEHRLVNSYVYNAKYGGILLNSSHSTITNANVNTCNVGITSKGNYNTIADSYINGCTMYGIRIDEANYNKIIGCTLKNSGGSSSQANLELETTTNTTVVGNTFEIPNAGTPRINLLVKTSIGKANISNNIFINPNSSNSYYDYGSIYNISETTFKNNGVVRLRNFQGQTLFPGVIEWDCGNITVNPTGNVTSTPSYSGFADGSIIRKTDYTDYYGYICKSGTWYPYGAIVS